MNDERGWSCPLPDDPVLAQYAAASNQAGTWVYLVDPQWRLVYMTDDARMSQAPDPALAPVPLGEHFLGAAVHNAAAMRMTHGGLGLHGLLLAFGAWVLADTPGGRAELRESIDPSLVEAVDEIPGPSDDAALALPYEGAFSRAMRVPMVVMGERIYDSEGRYRGATLQAKPAVGMSVISQVVATGDLRHFERMRSVSRARRQSAAILFADLEGSSPLSRRLSTSAYFALGRRLVEAADAAVVEAGGIVGRHVGDGVVTFFLAETAGSESAAATACIDAARALRTALAQVAERSGLDAADVTLRFGLHWGSTLYMGLIATSGRSEVTALGDEVNEAARIEACATGGRALASKGLIERLDPAAAKRLGVDPDRASYSPLSDLPSASAKARRDAPAIPVTEL